MSIAQCMEIKAALWSPTPATVFPNAGSKPEAAGLRGSTASAMGSTAPTTDFDSELPPEGVLRGAVDTAQDGAVSWRPARAGFPGRGAPSPSYMGTRATKMEVPPDKQGESQGGRGQVRPPPGQFVRERGNLGDLRVQVVCWALNCAMSPQPHNSYRRSHHCSLFLF